MRQICINYLILFLTYSKHPINIVVIIIIIIIITIITDLADG